MPSDDQPGPETGRVYRRLPAMPLDGLLPANLPYWRIELAGPELGSEPIGLDIFADVVIGRGRVNNQAADLDLDQFGASDLGLSRRHALLRPTANRLYIIDLASMNGTQINSIPIGQGVTSAVKHGDSITLGRMCLELTVISGPNRAPFEPAPGPAEPPATGPDQTPETTPLNPDDPAPA